MAAMFKFMSEFVFIVGFCVWLICLLHGWRRQFTAADFCFRPVMPSARAVSLVFMVVGFVFLEK